MTATQGDDRKIQAALKKLGVQPIAGVEEVNMFKEDGNVLHFGAPRGEHTFCRLLYLCGSLTHATVQAALPANTLAISGHGQTKELTELVPGILNQLGPDSLANLRRLAESYQSLTARQAAASAAAGGAGAAAKEGEVGDDDDEIPDLVEDFDQAGEKKPTDLEELE